MTREFGRTITNLRKKKGLSQKDAAAQLGISQSLLSHYEKGIRECGLEFLVKIADFYEVSTDFLLGRQSAESLSENLNDIDVASDDKIVKSNTYCLLNHRLITSSSSVIYSLLSKINNKKLQKTVSDYLGIAHYNMFRKIYSINKTNDEELFRFSSVSYETFCNAALNIQTAKIDSISSNIDGIKLSSDILADEYPESYSSLNELIKNAEKSVNQSIKIN